MSRIGKSEKLIIKMKNHIIAILRAAEVGNSGLHIDTIVERLINGGLVADQDKDAVKRRALSVINRAEEIECVRNGRGGRKQGWYKMKRITPPAPSRLRKVCAISAHPDANTTYTGTAGEYAVMSELLYQGYNVNSMTVDEGVDIVANKDNRFYFIQVKTAYLDENLKASFTIKNSRFDLFKQNNDMRYVFVVRFSSPLSTTAKTITENMFFAFTNVELDKAIDDGIIYKGDKEISVKIKFDSRDFTPYMYNNREAMKITYNMDRVI